jgi:hypothetical protein
MLPPTNWQPQVTILNPDHLFDQAERLIVSTAGAPRQVDLRRAISAAYYAVFHVVATAVADQFVGAGRRNTPEYALAYRRIDHKVLKALCAEIKAGRLPSKYEDFVPANGFSSDLKTVAVAAVELQERRIDSDYNPLISVKTSDAEALVATARDAAARFGRLSRDERRTFLCLLVFQPR